MTEEQKAQALSKLIEVRKTWPDLPKHVYTEAYESAILAYVALCVRYGHTEIESLVISILHHETGGREPYFRLDWREGQLGKILKSTRRKLLKVDWIKREVEAYQLVQEEKRYHELWAQTMHSGQTMSDNETEKSSPYATLATVTDEGLTVEYMAGRVVGQEYVVPVFIDSVNWGGLK